MVINNPISKEAVPSTLIFFDGVCNLCNGFVQFVIKHNARNNLKFCSLQSQLATDIFKKFDLDANQLDSVAFLHKGKLFFKSEAVFMILKYLDAPYKYGTFLRHFPMSLSNIIYDYVARKRYRFFGKRDACWMPTPELKQRFVG